MQDLLRELAKEREERTAATGPAAASHASASSAGAPAGRAEGRSRKQSAPHRRVTSSTAAEQPHRTAASTREAPQPDAKADQKNRKNGGGAKAREGAGKERKKVKMASLEFEDAGGAFDPVDVAGAFLRDDFGEGREGLGTLAFDQFAAAARLHALETNKVAMQNEAASGAGGAAQVRVDFTGNNKKAYTDHCRLYTAAEITSIFRAILSYNQSSSAGSSSRRRASSARHLLKADILAARYPPLLWSIYSSRPAATPFKGARELAGLVEAFAAQADAGGDT